MSVMSKMVCILFARGDKKRDAGLTTPGEVIRYDDIVYGEDPKWQTLDVYRPRNAEGKLIRDLMPHKGTEEELRLITPLHHLNSSFPPAFIMTAVNDFLKDDAMKIRSKLDDLGVSNEYHLYDNDDHTLGHVFHVNIRLEEAKKCNDEECSFFRKQG